MRAKTLSRSSKAAKSFNIPACTTAFAIISNDTLHEKFTAENSALTVNKNNAFASVAMQAAYGQSADWLEQVLICLESNMTLVKTTIRKLPQVELIDPEGIFLLWLNFRELSLTPEEIHFSFGKRRGGRLQKVRLSANRVRDLPG